MAPTLSTYLAGFSTSYKPIFITMVRSTGHPTDDSALSRCCLDRLLPQEWGYCYSEFSRNLRWWLSEHKYWSERQLNSKPRSVNIHMATYCFSFIIYMFSFINVHHHNVKCCNVRAAGCGKHLFHIQGHTH